MIDIIDWNALHEQHPDFVELVGQEIDELDWYALLLAGAGRAYLTALFCAEVKSTDFMAHPMVELLRAKVAGLLDSSLL